jgi:conserved oligomeric Golgi complex subunit 1
MLGDSHARALATTGKSWQRCTSRLENFAYNFNAKPSMASQIPDPRSLDNWEDVFQYPLPVVRKLEQQLRKNIDENRQKLRSLVGASYRDLLGTAERIIEMDGQITTVEEQLSDIGRRCNAPTLERIGDNHARMVKTRVTQEKERLGIMAQRKVLQSALTAAARTMRAGGDALLVSKLLVLARLLHKSVSESSQAPAVLPSLQKEFNRLRKRLFSFIEGALVKKSTEKASLANALCAYSLVSSSVPKDVLRHFLQVRFHQIEVKSEQPSEDDILDMLQVYERTVSDTRGLFPKLLIESLSRLTQAPLLDDAQVRDQYALNLDIYGQWIADSVRAFTPWVRHDQLLSSDVNDALASWSKQAQKCILAAMKDCVERTNSDDQVQDASTILDMRKQVVLQYLGLSSHSRDGDFVQTIKELRTLYLEKLKLLASNVADAGKGAIDLSDTSGKKDRQAALNLWDLAANDIDLSRGGKRLRSDVNSRRCGHDRDITSYTYRLDDWMTTLDTFSSLIQRMRTTKWDEELEIDFDDIPDGEETKEGLNKGDPDSLQDHFRTAVLRALQWSYTRIQELCDAETEPTTLLRILRGLRQRQLLIQEQYGILEFDEQYLSMAGTFHTRTAHLVASASLEQYYVSLQKGPRVAVTLWDGSPALPVQPSPDTYRMLLSLHKAMSGLGGDLWSPRAVAALKDSLDGRLAELLASSPAISKQDGGLTNGHSESQDGEDKTSVDSEQAQVNGAEGSAETQRNRQLQLVFDVMYLRRIITKSTSPHAGEAEGLRKEIAELQKRLELPEALIERLRKSANEYWKRTFLLFGLLAPEGG